MHAAGGMVPVHVDARCVLELVINVSDVQKTEDVCRITALNHSRRACGLVRDTMLSHGGTFRSGFQICCSTTA